MVIRDIRFLRKRVIVIFLKKKEQNANVHSTHCDKNERAVRLSHRFILCGEYEISIA